MYTQTNSKGKVYYLNCKNIVLRSGKETTLYYFSKDERTDTGCDLPEDKEVFENERTGMLMLRGKK